MTCDVVGNELRSGGAMNCARTSVDGEKLLVLSVWVASALPAPVALGPRIWRKKAPTGPPGAALPDRAQPPGVLDSAAWSEGLSRPSPLA
jgi:hypothetical protein